MPIPVRNRLAPLIALLGHSAFLLEPLQHYRARAVLIQFPRALLILLFLAPVKLTRLPQCLSPCLQVARLVFKTLDLVLLCSRLLFIFFLRLQQIIGSRLIVFDLQQGVKGLFALAGRFQEDSSEGTLRHAQRVAKERAQRAFALNAKQIMQLIQDIRTLLNLVIGLTIVDKPARTSPAAPLNLVPAIITADQVDDDAPVLLPLTHKLALVIGQIIEESEADRFQNGCLARPIRAANRGCPAPEINFKLPIALDILQLNPCNEHSCIAFPANTDRHEIDDSRFPSYSPSRLKKRKRAAIRIQSRGIITRISPC